MALFLSLICISAYGQKKLSGTVLDANGDPIIGATVNVDGKNGAITDLDGAFKLDNVKSSSRITVSYVGYKPQTLTVGERSVLDVKLQEDNEQLDEIVVVGYQTMKKSDLTGSVGSINTEDLTSKGTASVMEALQGSVPGVSITQTGSRAGGDFNIEIRGKSSINSDQGPLYVVDGVICDDIQWLNQQDIERIDILKDASSTAIYGSRATAGVVLVTTKSGTTVQKKESKPTISYDGYWGFTKTTRMPEFQSAEQFYNYRFFKFLTYAGGLTQSTAGAQPNYVMNSYEQMALYSPTEGSYRLKSIIANGEQTYDWPSLVTQTGQQQNHFITLNGSSEKVSYHFGVGYSNEKGIYKGDEQSKINFKGALDAKLNKYISAGFSLNGARINHDYANDNAIKYAYRMNPFMVPYDSEGNLWKKPGNYEAMGTGTSSYQFSDQINPLISMMNEEQNRETWRLMGNIYVDIKPFKDLDFKSTFSPNYTNYRQGHFTNNLEDASSATEGTYQTHRSFSWTWDNQVTYNKEINKIHRINLMGLVSANKGNTENTYMDFQNVREGTKWWALGTGDNVTGKTYNNYSENSLLSYAVRANYTLKDRYMLTATVRWDGSSRFSEGHKWGSFPSLALAYRISEEDWFKKALPFVSNTKLRLSYGVTGNNNVSNYATILGVSNPVYYPFGSTYYNGTYPNGIVDPDLQWEKSHEFNAGLDFGFLNERINGSIDWYVKTSKDLLYGVDLPLVAGGTTVTTNIGSVKNTGVEANITGLIIKNKDWNWSVTASFAHNNNEVKEINGSSSRAVSNSNPETGSLFVGYSVNNVYGYNWTGIVSDKLMTVPDNEIARTVAAKNPAMAPGSKVRECDYYYAAYGWTEGQPIIEDVDGNGKFDDNDKHIWSSDPVWTGSISTNVSYKGWDLSASIYTKQNYRVSSNFYGEYMNYADRGRMKLNVDYYIPAGTIIDCDGVNSDGTYINPVYQETTHYGSYPFPNNAGNNAGVGTSLWTAQANKYVDASYWKVKNITLGYTFPKKWIQKIGCQHLRLYCTVTNPFVISSYKGFDPEWANAQLKNDGPSTITCQFGANIKF